MKNRTFRVAVVGCGTIAPSHLNALLLIDSVEVVALCDINTDRARALAERYCPDVRIFSDYCEMLNATTLDAVHIATPHYLHRDMTVAALERGINVFLEKPMCISQNEINDIIDAERNSSAKICVCFQNRFIKAIEHAQKVINDDGGIKSIYCSVFWNRDKKYYTESSWRGRYATEGGGVMINQAIHTIDLLTMLLGKPKSVCATTANHHLKGVIEVEDTCEGIITFESGKKANFYATTSAVEYDDTSVVIRTENHKIVLDLPNVTVDGVMTSYENDKHYIGKRCYGNGHVQLIARFYNALENSEPMPVSAESAQYALKILLAAYKSCDKEIII